ncbi:MAG: M23 family metallopeptidase [Clostridia bacterium]|nr:M23 family metallopeptidase [Clostridia bacterium]
MSQNTQKLKKIIKNSILPVLSFTLFLGTVSYLNNQNYGLALEYNGKQIATLSHEDVFEKAHHMVVDQLTQSGKSKVESKYSQIKIVPVKSSECCESPSEIKNKIIENSQDIFVEACGIYVDDKLIGVGETEEAIKKMFDEVTEEQKKLNPDKTINITENIEFKKGYFAPEDVKSNLQLKNYFFKETEKEFKYIAAENETIASIAEKFDVPEETIREKNNIEGDTVSQDNVLVIALKESILHLKFSRIFDEEKEIPFETKEISNDSKYKSWSKVINEGENGKETFTYEVEYDINGRELRKTELSHAIISEPVNKVIEKGTKEEPEGFMWPVPYTRHITSPFGPRWGTIHKGIDIADAGVFGTDIVASEDGVVEKASYGSKGYGNHIIIKHDGGYSTLYGHCKELCVSVGDKVKKGQVIAKVGSTGDSTGPHLHFEIRVNGKQEDPMKYLNLELYL